MMKKLLSKVIISTLVAAMVLTPNTALAATKQVEVKLTGKVVLLENSREGGSYVGESDEPELTKGKDGVYTLTMYSAQLVGIQFKKNSNYWVAATNNKGGTGAYKYNDGSSEAKSDYTIVDGATKSETEPTVHMLTLSYYHYVSKNGKKTVQAVGKTMKLKLVVKPNIPEFSYDRQAEAEFIVALNKDRVARGLNPVVQTPEMQAYSETRAKELVDCKFSHIRPDGLEENGSLEVIHKGGAGEDGEDVFREFKKSPEHYNDLCVDSVGQFGIAIYKCGGRLYVCSNLMENFE